ncbi:MAG: ferredoxin reductase, partial [Burkholderiaceae bacterium]|nr:ferredoxin reductase [Burkholderiaceae bacterium]
LAPPEGERLRRPGSTPESFSILHYVGDALVCVESINAPADHLAARKMFERGKSAPRAQAIDPAVPLKSFM